mgnify:CR=1 FL=1
MRLSRAVLAAGVLSFLAGQGALAADGGAGVYLLGKRGPLAAFLPKPGWYLTDDQAELEIVAAAEGDNLGGGAYSPDGRWIAYHTETAAAWDVFVMPAGGGSRKWQVTSDGAVYPKWSEDGSELWVSRFNGDLRVYAVDGRGETLRIGGFRDTVNVTSPDASGCYYDLHPDGVRILQTGIDPAFQAEVSYLHLVTDWQRGLVQ